MCGIVGYAGNGINLNKMRAIMLDTERSRGGHAFGFAWITASGRLRMYKQAGSLRMSPAALDMVKDATMFVGHVRYATVGNVENVENNHPHHCDGGWLAHNGTLRSEILALARTLPAIGDCDSELLARFVEVSPKRTFCDRVSHALEFASADGSEHALVGIWRNPAVIIAATSGKPMFYSGKDGETYLASLPDRLGGKPTALATGKVLTVKQTRE